MIKSKYLKSSIFLTLDKVIRLLINIITFAAIAYLMTVKEFALYSYSMLIFGILSVILSLGLDEISVKEIITAYNKKGKDTFTLISVFLKMIFSIPVVVGWIYFSGQKEILFYAFALLLVPLNSLRFQIEAKGIGKKIIFPSLIGCIVFAIAKFFVVTQEDPVYYMGVILFLETLYGVVVSCYFIEFRNFIFFKKLFYLSKIFKSSIPLWVSGFISIVYLKIDQIFIEKFYGLIKYGSYSFATRLVEVAYVLPSLAMSSMIGFLMISKISSKQVFQFFYVLTTIVGVLSIFGFIILSAFINKYDNFLTYSLILSLSLPFNALRVCSGKFYILQGLTYLSLVRSVQSLILILILILILNPIFGIYSAPLSLLITSIYAGVLVDFWNPLTKPVFYEKIEVVKQSFSLQMYRDFFMQIKKFSNSKG